MINFENFVIHVVNKWRTEKKIILERGGLAGISNREYGDLAENYILKRIGNLVPNYKAQKSAGSQSPADILSVGRRNGYWHIMLVQVKSSSTKDSIAKLDDLDKKVFDEFAKFLKSEIIKSGLLDQYKDKPIIISTGYAAVLRTKTAHRLVESKAFKLFTLNSSNLNATDVREKVRTAHNL